MNQNGLTCLHTACIHRHVEFVKYLCAAGVAQDTCDTRGQTALHYASCEGFREIVDVLCRAVADKDRADDKGYTGLTTQVG